MTGYRVLVRTGDDDRIDVNAQVDNPTQAKTVALAKFPGGSVSGIMDVDSDEWVEPDPEKDAPLPNDQIPDVEAERSDSPAASAVKEASSAFTEALKKHFAPALTLGGVIAFVFLSSALFTASMGSGANAMFGALSVSAFDIESDLLGMTMAYPATGLYLIAVICAWFARAEIVPHKLAMNLILATLLGMGFLLYEAMVTVMELGALSAIELGFWVQIAFCSIFFVWAVIIEK